LWGEGKADKHGEDGCAYDFSIFHDLFPLIVLAFFDFSP
jgi:hypothetical protein